MHLERVDGELYLCAGSDQACGEPGDPDVGAIWEQPDPEDPETLQCQPYQDPPSHHTGAEPFDTPRLLLVRGDDNGRTVEIRERPSGAQAATRWNPCW